MDVVVMDDILIRPRYYRHGMSGRRKKRNIRTEGMLAEKLTRQFLISILILVIAILVKSISTPVTDFITGKIREVVEKNIDFKNLYEKIDSLLKGLKKSENAATVDLSDGNGIYESGTAEDSANKDMAKLVSESVSLDGMDSSISAIKEKYMFIAPVEGKLTSRFGERIDPITKELRLHKGIDIEADKGSAIKSSLGGTVIEAGSERTYGNYIKIKHDDGIVTVYAHCSQLFVQKGQEVKQGDIIAKVGDTGASVGSHLHFEIWKDEKAIDPLYFVNIPSN